MKIKYFVHLYHTLLVRNGKSCDFLSEYVLGENLSYVIIIKQSFIIFSDLTEIQTMDMSLESLNADIKTEQTLSSSVSLSDIRVTPAEPKLENQIITEIC